jgi:opacity protein-like surface antigen
MKKRIVLALVTTMFSTQLALADDAPQDQQWNRHQGFYVEANGGTNLYYFAVFSTGEDTSASGFTGGGWSAAVGYNFKPIYAAEVGFMQNYAKFEDEEDDDIDVSTHTNVPYAAARFDVPIGDRFGFIAKLGLMIPSIADNDVDAPTLILPFVGVGGSYAITPNLDVSLQYQGAVYVIVGGGLFSGGLTYHF